MMMFASTFDPRRWGASTPPPMMQPGQMPSSLFAADPGPPTLGSATIASPMPTAVSPGTQSPAGLGSALITEPTFSDHVDVPALPPIDLSNVQRPGFFQHGGVGEKILNGLGEFSLRTAASLGDPVSMNTLQQRMQSQRDAAQQQAEFQRQLAVEAYKRAHPDPTEFEKTMIAGGYRPGTPEYAALARQKAQADAVGTPFVYEQYNPTTGATDKVIAPRTAIPGMAPPTQTGGGPTVGTIVAGHRYLGGPTNDPRSWQDTGGAAPTAPSPFPTR